MTTVSSVACAQTASPATKQRVTPSPGPSAAGRPATAAPPDQQNRDKRRAKYALKIQQITVVDIEGLDSLGIEQLKEQLQYWKDKCATWDGAYPKMMKAVQIGKTPPLYAIADYQTEKERILYVLRFTLRMQ
eukprot:COSAG01_NODE_16996_length_1186_cov_2.431463_1_plen_131_part_10